MLDAVYIGDEVTGAGWRLAGIRTVVADAEEAADALAAACRQEAGLVLMGAGSAAGIPGSELAARQRAGRPLVLVVPDVRGHEPPDVAATVNRAFGLET